MPFRVLCAGPPSESGRLGPANIDENFLGWQDSNSALSRQISLANIVAQKSAVRRGVLS